MSAAACPACGAAHGLDRRYCLACGTLVGRRPVDPEQALTPAPPDAPAPSPVAADAPPSVWRRPATSVATVLALATGVTAGFLLDPQGGAAERAPVVVRGLSAARSVAAAPVGAPTPATPSPGAADAGAAEPGDAAGGPGGTAAPATTDAPTPAGAGPADAATAPAAGGSAPAETLTPAAAGASSAPATSAAATTTATGPATARPATRPAPARDPHADAPRTRAAADGLPRIAHVWVVGIATPVAAREGGYLGETLLARGTELPRYAPASTDPVAGAAALIAGRDPSPTAPTVGDQLTAAKRPWRVYAPGAPSCADAPSANPFLAFASVASAADCADHVAALSALPGDLAREDATPAFSYVATDPALDPADLDAQLQGIVEPIRRSPAFRRSGLLLVVPTAAPRAAPTGALVLSPFAAGSTAVATRLGPYALLRTVQDALGLDRLGHAADAGVRALGPDVLVPKD